MSNQEKPYEGEQLTFLEEGTTEIKEEYKKDKEAD